ncbi:vWA domain-containing protein [Sorangium sp. So ce1099]|uniref:vWA domain-containing protein n=1 Tax=Sorangium sp. So ce1099 TaxID=3133331 RepID=UPI003F61BA96
MKLPTMTIVLLTVGAIGVACGGNGASDDGGSSEAGSGNGSASTSTNGGTGEGGAGFGGLPNVGGDLSSGGTSNGGSSGEGGACATETAKADLEPVYLAFAFDVSGSMGKGDELWHDKSLKWDPVVAATKQFFADPLSQGLNASLRFFPSAGDDDDTDTKCDAETYLTPEVPMTPLPSPAFAEAIDAVTPETSDDWRGGTPTLFVMQGTISYVTAQRQATPGRYAIVLVTDGYPAGCGSRYNQVSLVADEAAIALADEIPTYVIGVANPPIEGAPETVKDMDDVAVAGGTEHAYLIDTGNPAATAAAFKAAVDAIRGAAVSCTVAIPAAPDGRTFDAQKVRVTYTSGDEAIALTYDQECETEEAWRYDSAENPTQIVLCDSTCAAIQADPAAALGVDFTCEDVITIPR